MNGLVNAEAPQINLISSLHLVYGSIRAMEGKVQILNRPSCRHRRSAIEREAVSAALGARPNYFPPRAPRTTSSGYPPFLASLKTISVRKHHARDLPPTMRNCQVWKH